MDQGPWPALLVVSSNLMALCVAGSYSWARAASCSSVFLGRSVASGVLRELFKTIEVEGLCQSLASTFFHSLRRSAGRLGSPQAPPCPLPPTSQRSNVKPSIRRQAARGTWPLDKTLPCSSLGLESSWPIGLASWIKRLDCAPSYSSTSRSRRFQPVRPNVSRCEALLLVLLYLICCRQSTALATWLE